MRTSYSLSFNFKSRCNKCFGKPSSFYILIDKRVVKNFKLPNLKVTPTYDFYLNSYPKNFMSTSPFACRLETYNLDASYFRSHKNKFGCQDLMLTAIITCNCGKCKWKAPFNLNYNKSTKMYDVDYKYYTKS